MKMRFLSVLLMVFLVFGLFSLHVFAIDGDPLSQGDGQVDHVDDPDDEIFVGTDITIDDLRISPEGLEMIKDLEGCVNTPMWDVSQMSIGYGCSTVYAEKYGFSTSHLSDEEAEQLLLCVLGEFEKKLEKFVKALRLTESDDIYEFYNLAGERRGGQHSDINDYMERVPRCRFVLRTANDQNWTDEDWQRVLEMFEGKK